ncbi:sensor domain-containing protein [Methylocaldum szegediense]|uniref:Diguanylate cyclase n=1 Tax=Methylocaldum szegediense TaxID=73780 RepID=A0ABN8X8K1_9GAMM|nr:EAL domain-containing protein [Methylocaldum szegediense]CAI8898706.1 diguanylate cyclase [Methylocaldum szegediense]
MAEFAYLSPLRLIDFYAFYGLSFLILATVVFLQPRSDRMLPFASELWLLGIFGTLHGIKEWLDAWTLLNRAENAGLHWLNACILVLSYLALFEFGRRLAMICAVSRPSEQPSCRAWLGLWVYLPLLGGVYATTSVADDAARGLSAGGRIFFGFSGGVLSGLSLVVRRGRVCGWPVLPETKPYFYVAAGALIVYAVGAGLVVEGDTAFPAWLPTTGSFFAVAGIPVHLLRGLCGVALTFALVIITRSANVAARKQEEAARAETAALTASLAERVRESTVSLEAANRRLLKEIEDRKLIEQDLREREADLRRAQSVAHVGSWHLDVTNNTLRGSAEMYRILGMSEALPLALEDFLTLVHSEDRAFVERSWQAALRGETYDVEYRIMVAGEVRWVRERAELDFDRNGRPVAGTGIVQDITQRKLAEDEVRHAKELIQLVVDSIPVYVALIDREQRYVLVNRGYEDWFQRSRGEIIGKRMPELMDPEVYEQAKPRVQAALSGEAVRYELLAKNPKGLPRWLDIQYVPRTDEKGTVSGFFALWHDITHRKHTEQRLRRVLERLRFSENRQRELARLAQQEQRRMGALLSAMSIGILLEDRQGIIEYVNPAFLRMWAIEESFEPVGRATRDVLEHSTHRFARPDHASKHVLRVLDTHEASERFELELYDGRVLAQISYPVTDDDGQTIGRLWIYEDITFERQTAKQLLDLAERDPLTGLFNRHRFQDQLERLITTSVRTGTKFCLIYFDLDEFKYINDTFGHKAGDTVLVRIAGEISTLVRHEETFARLGGDEFAILSTLTPNSDLNALPARIANAIAAIPFRFRGTHMRVTGSVGVAVFPDHGDNAEDLVAHADAAMYQAKGQGKNTWAIYDPTRDSSEAMMERLSWNQRIAESLQKDLFELHFQGVYSVGGGGLSHLEVLVRMQNPADPASLIMPGQFISMAEKSGQITEIDRWVLKRSIELLARNPSIPPLAVNISGRTFDDLSLPHFIRRQLKQNGVDPARLIIELTETAAVSDIQDAQRFIEAIHQAGCRVCLDDFGSGFSTFGYLKYLGVEVLKIDGLFIRDLPNNRDNQIFVKAMVDVARGLQKLTVAEYVEDAATLSMVRSLGVNLVQGYYLDCPVADHPALTEYTSVMETRSQ